MKILFVLALVSVLLSADFQVTNNTRAVTIHWSLDESDIDQIQQGGQKPSGKEMFQSVVNGYIVPIYSQRLSQSIQPRIEIVHQEAHLINLVKAQRPASEKDSDGNALELNTEPRNYFLSAEVQEDQVIIRFTPYLPHEGQTLRFVSTFEAIITYEEISGKTAFLKADSKGNLVPDKYVNAYLKEPGFYRITGQMLRDAGVSLGEIDPDALTVFRWNKEVPVLVETRQPNSFTESDYIGIWIDSLANPYTEYHNNPFATDEAIRISWSDGRGLRYSEESGAIGDPVDHAPTYFDSDIHVEKDESWNKLMQRDQDELSYFADHWFFKDQIISGKSAIYNFDLQNPARSLRNVDFRLNMEGVTYGAEEEKFITFLVNGTYMGSESWLIRNETFLFNNSDFNYSHALLHKGSNKLQIVLSGDPTVDQYYDIMQLNWLDINYDRYFIAAANQLEFHAPHGMGSGSYLFEIHGFTTPQITVIKNNFSRIRDYVVYENNDFGGYSVIFQNTVSGATVPFVAVGDDGMKIPDTLIYRDRFREAPETAEGDLIIVSAEQFSKSSQTLAEHKNRVGFDAVYYSLEQIYDNYSNGNITPFAIKEFLQDVCANWTLKPRYLILIGDARDDGRQSIRQIEYIPTIFFQTYRWGASVSDFWFGDVDDDNIQEVILGRLPVRDQEQLEIVVDKIIRYEEEPTIDYWLNRVTVIAGYEDDFKDQTEAVINTHIPEGLQIDRIYINPSAQAGPYYGTTESLADMFNDGKVWVNFLGHGGGAVWADRGLFSLDDVGLLTNTNKPAMVTSMTCFTAAFETEQGLGEMMIRSEGGAVTFLGSSGLGWIINDFLLLDPILTGLFDKQMTFGEAVAYGKIQYYLTTPYSTLRKTMINQYNILGDPTLKMPIDFEPDDLTITPQDPSSGEPITISYSSHLSKALLDVTYQSTSDNRTPLLQKLELVNGNNTFQAIIDTILPAGGDAVLFAWDAATGMVKAAHASFSVDQSFIGEPEWYPSQPEISGNAFIQAIISDSEGIKTVHLITVTADTILMTNRENSIFRTVSALAVSSNSGIRFRILAEDLSGNLTWSAYETLQPNQLYDIILSSYSISNGKSNFTIYSGSTDPVNIVAAIQGNGFSKLDTFAVYSGNRIYSRNILPEYGLQTISVSLTSDIAESNTDNNSGEFSLNNEWLTVGKTEVEVTLTHPWISSLTFASQEAEFAVHIEPGVLSGTIFPTWIHLADSTQLRLTGSESQTVFATLSSQHEIGIPLWLSTDMSDAYCLEMDHSTVTLPADGYLLWVIAGESIIPEIEINVNGRQFLSDSYVSKYSDFSILLRDNTGVHPLPPFWSIKIDDQLLSEDDVTRQKGPDMTELNLRFKPELSAGRHSLQVVCNDIFGNADSTDVLNLVVASGFEIIDYGNFPNPFQSKTTIIYELTEQFEELEINIYTVAGRRVFTINSMNAETDLALNEVGYHEVIWRGVDMGDNFVANGVYFYDIVGTVDYRKLHQRGKAVKLR